MIRKIGFTTNFPMEVTFAAGIKAVDLNNIFVNYDSNKYIEFAEFNGYPRNICSWIKGMYGIVAKYEKFDAIIGIVQGDCSNTHSLMETINQEKIDVIPFSYPYDYSDDKSLDYEIKKLESRFNVTRKQTEEAKKFLDNIRKKLQILDEFTWNEKKVTGLENHIWMVNSSDFECDPETYEKKLDEFLSEVKFREKINYSFKFAYLGVPPIIPELYDFLMEIDANIIFNEVQRQFSMPYNSKNIVEQYQKFTYPYSVRYRLEDIKKEIKKRNIDGIIHYGQAFCHRQIDEIILKKNLNYPFIAIEGNEPNKLDERTKLRIESFLDMLKY